jgi:hypothetical protein
MEEAILPSDIDKCIESELPILGCGTVIWTWNLFNFFRTWVKLVWNQIIKSVAWTFLSSAM